MIDSTELLLEGFIETQLKLKILHSSRTICSKDTESLATIKKNILRLLLKVLYSVTLKKVLSSKITNRIVLKFFRKFVSASPYQNSFDLHRSTMTLDKSYLTTVAINSLHEFYTKKVS